MGQVDSSTHSTGVEIYRISGTLTRDDVEAWHTRITRLVKDNAERGACGALIDVCRLEGLTAGAIDALIEHLSAADELVAKTRLRLALIGVSPHTERLLREALARSPIKNLQGRFFHVVAEPEALAWLQVVIETAAASAPEAAAPPKLPEKPVPIPKRALRLLGGKKKPPATPQAEKPAAKPAEGQRKPA